MTTRRGFLGVILAATASPAIVKFSSLMKIWLPPERGVIVIDWDYYNGTGRDVGPFLQRALDKTTRLTIPTGIYSLGSTLILKSNTMLDGGRSTFTLPKDRVIFKRDESIKGVTISNFNFFSKAK